MSEYKLKKMVIGIQTSCVIIAVVAFNTLFRLILKDKLHYLSKHKLAEMHTFRVLPTKIQSTNSNQKIKERL